MWRAFFLHGTLNRTDSNLTYRPTTMSDFARVANIAELPDEDAAQEYTVNGRAICITKVDGHCYALDNVCPHQGGPLGQGYVDGGKLVCPWHGMQFDPRTGKSDDGDGVAVYELRIDGNDVLVKL